MKGTRVKYEVTDSNIVSRTIPNGDEYVVAVSNAQVLYIVDIKKMKVMS
jgi:hypothetical protein